MRHLIAPAIALAMLAPTASGDDVRIAAPDGVPLAATYTPASSRGPGILLLHQCNRDRSSWGALPRRLAERGFHVLALDYRGYGDSGGPRYLELPFAEQVRVTAETWPGDVDAALAWLRSQDGVAPSPVGVAGASCGVNQAVQLSRRDGGVASLALLSGNTNRAGRLHLKGSRVPVLAAAADDDGGAADVAAWLEALSGSPTKRLMRYATGGHGTVMFEARPELPGAIAAWFEATLLGRGELPAATSSRAASPTLPLLLLLDEPGGMARLARRLAEERARDPRSEVLDPAFVNQLGYEAIASGDTAAAVDILRVNTQTHPRSSNAWDSLGDAHLANGQPDEARAAARKALALVDDDATETEERRKLIRDSARQKLEPLAPPSTP